MNLCGVSHQRWRISKMIHPIRRDTPHQSRCIKSGSLYKWWDILKMVHITGCGSHYQRYNTLMTNCSSSDSLTIHKVMRSWRINYSWPVEVLEFIYAEANAIVLLIFSSRYLAISRVYFWYCVWERVGPRRFGLREPVFARIFFTGAGTYYYNVFFSGGGEGKGGTYN